MHAHAGIPYRAPSAHELPGRIDGVLGVVYVLFTTGYNATPPPHDQDPTTDVFMEERNQAFEEEVDRLMDERGSGRLSDEEMRAAVDQHLEDSLMPPEPRMPPRSDRTVAGSLAEVRAAKKLGISVAALREAAIDLWARPLEEESSRRAGPGSSPQARGRITRTLIDEIRRSEEKDK